MQKNPAPEPQKESKPPSKEFNFDDWAMI